MSDVEQEPVVNDPATLADVTACVARYEAALMANDVAVLDLLFRNAPHTIRYGAGENLYGFEAIAAYRLARPGGAPQRRVLRQVVTTYGTCFATADLEFEPLGTTRRGRQSQSWIRFTEGWRIVAAHVSFMSS